MPTVTLFLDTEHFRLLILRRDLVVIGAEGTKLSMAQGFMLPCCIVVLPAWLSADPQVDYCLPILSQTQALYTRPPPPVCSFSNSVDRSARYAARPTLGGARSLDRNPPITYQHTVQVSYVEKHHVPEL